ncbi:ester cyclase [Nonomuraea sp. NPDC005983]|uniref:ester cyclase n=1 Tax=unclassified Nonomuraea TaxID=2593643 RepID=UPI00332575FE
MKDIVMRLYDEVLNQGKLDVVDEIFAPTFTGTGPARPGPEGIKQLSEHIRSTLTEPHFDVQDMVAEGDKVATRWVLQGTHSGAFFGLPATNRPVEVRACVIFRIENNQIAEFWPVIDTSSLRAA